MTVIVADNGCEAATLAIADATARTTSRCPTRARRGPQRAGRQGRLARADWTWLAMLDDDGRVAPPWLAPLVACGETLDAHLVGGPVEAALPAGAGRLARNSLFAGRRRAATGRVAALNGAQNLMIARGLVDLLGTPLFQTAYDRSGGEDYDLFRRAAAAGARMAWCAEAVVTEPAPPEQLRARRLLARYCFDRPLHRSRIDRTSTGRPGPGRSALKGLAGVAARGAAATLRGDLDAAAAAALMLGHFGGRVAGLLGAESERYAAP